MEIRPCVLTKSRAARPQPMAGWHRGGRDCSWAISGDRWGVFDIHGHRVTFHNARRLRLYRLFHVAVPQDGQPA